MRLLVCLFLALLAPAAAAEAAAVEATVSRGDVSVVLRATAGEDPGADDEPSSESLRGARGLTVEVSRGGIVTRPAAPLAACRFGCGAKPFVTATIADVDADGVLDVLVDRSDGFNVCCTQETVILLGTGRELRARLGSGYTLGPEGLLGDDVRFYARYEPRVFGTFLPRRVWRIAGDRLVDVTARYPALVRTDAAGIWDVIAPAMRRRTDTNRRILRAALPAWLAEERVIGKRATGERVLDRLVRRRFVTAAYARSVRAFLRRSGW